MGDSFRCDAIASLSFASLFNSFAHFCMFSYVIIHENNTGAPAAVLYSWLAREICCDSWVAGFVRIVPEFLGDKQRPFCAAAILFLKPHCEVVLTSFSLQSGLLEEFQMKRLVK